MSEPIGTDMIRAFFPGATAESGTPKRSDGDASLLTAESGTPKSSDDDDRLVDTVLVVEDIAALLRVGRNTVYGLVARNQIPHRRLGKTIRFSRAAVMSWLSSSWQVAKEGK